jgi:hypothetical protein
VVAQGIGGPQVGEEISGGAEGGNSSPDALVLQAAKSEMSATLQWVLNLRPMARGIYGTRFPTSIRPRFPKLASISGPQVMDMDASPLEPTPVSSRSHWTDPAPREETLTIREKFRKIGWRQPNNKASTTKSV